MISVSEEAEDDQTTNMLLWAWTQHEIWTADRCGPRQFCYADAPRGTAFKWTLWRAITHKKRSTRDKNAHYIMSSYIM